MKPHPNSFFNSLNTNLYKLLTITVTTEFILVRTLHRLFPPLYDLGYPFLLFSTFLGLYILYILISKLSSPLKFFGYLYLISVIITIIFSIAWKQTPIIISLIYYTLLPVLLTGYFSYLFIKYKRNLRHHRIIFCYIAMLLLSLSLILYSYFYINVSIRSHYSIILPYNSSLVTISLYFYIFSLIFLSLYILLHHRTFPRIKLFLSIFLPSLIFIPILLVSWFIPRILNYLALYFIEVYNIPLPLIVTPLFLVILYISLISLLLSIGAFKSGSIFSLGYVMILLGAFHLEIIYYPMIFTIGLLSIDLYIENNFILMPESQN